MSVKHCENIANNLVKPALVEYNKHTLNWELKLLANRSLLNYLCEDELVDNDNAEIRFVGDSSTESETGAFLAKIRSKSKPEVLGPG